MAIVPSPDASASLTLDKIKAWLEGSTDVFKYSITDVLYTIAAGLAIIMIIWGAYQYLTAYGNEERAEQGKKIILWTVIGIVVIILASLIVSTIKGILIINPTTNPPPGTPGA